MLQNETATTTATPAAGTPEVSPANSAMPNIGAMSTADLESMLKPQTASAESKPAEPAPAESKPELPVPDKFKNPDGTPNLSNLLKSYQEAEKRLGQTNNANHENEMLKQQLADLQAEIAERERVQEELRAQAQQASAPEEELTTEQMMRKVVADEMEKREAAARKQRMEDYEVFAAINTAREKLPYFKQFEPEIEALASRTNKILSKSPDSVELLYNATIGMKTPELVNLARTQAFKEGYEKAKAEMKMQVEGGGRDTTPVDTSLNTNSIGGLSAAELEKLLPKMGDNSTKILY